MIERAISEVALKMVNQYPVLTILGPWQSGKTTLAKAIFPEYSYVNLEHPAEREYAHNDPERFIKKYLYKSIIDELGKNCK